MHHFNPSQTHHHVLLSYMLKWPNNKGTVFFSNISYAMYKHTNCCFFKSLIIPSNPQTKGSTMTIICPDKVTGTVPLQQPFHILRLSPACSATSYYFYLPWHYEDPSMVMNVSLDTANINTFNISTLDFIIWQHFSMYPTGCVPPSFMASPKSTNRHSP